MIKIKLAQKMGTDTILIIFNNNIEMRHSNNLIYYVRPGCENVLDSDSAK